MHLVEPDLFGTSTQKEQLYFASRVEHQADCFWLCMQMSDEKEQGNQRRRLPCQSSDGDSMGIAKPVFTRSIMTIVLKPLMSEFS